MANTTTRTALLALGLILLSMPALASSSATASAGATIVDRISIASASEARESGNRLSVDSSSASGPLAVSIEIGSAESLPSSSVGVADHLQVNLEDEHAPDTTKEERTARKQAPVTMIVHAY